MSAGARLAQLRADCARCAGLCCVALPFTRSREFAFDKPPATPCRHLRQDFGCAIHGDLHGHGFSGCASFDCFGAGQHVVQVMFADADWRSDPDDAAQMFDAFNVVRQLHEMLWYLNQAAMYVASGDLHATVEHAITATQALVDQGPTEVADIVLPAHRAGIGDILRRVSAAVRTDSGAAEPLHASDDLAGHDLRDKDLRAADLRSAVLIGVDLRGVDLNRADMLGADLRDADLRGAHLDAVLFLTQPQLAGAHGDAATTLPSELVRPAHWTALAPT